MSEASGLQDHRQPSAGGFASLRRLVTQSGNWKKKNAPSIDGLDSSELPGRIPPFSATSGLEHNSILAEVTTFGQGERPYMNDPKEASLKKRTTFALQSSGSKLKKVFTRKSRSSMHPNTASSQDGSAHGAAWRRQQMESNYEDGDLYGLATSGSSLIPQAIPYIDNPFANAQQDTDGHRLRRASMGGLSLESSPALHATERYSSQVSRDFQAVSGTSTGFTQSQEPPGSYNLGYPNDAAAGRFEDVGSPLDATRLQVQHTVSTPSSSQVTHSGHSLYRSSSLAGADGPAPRHAVYQSVSAPAQPLGDRMPRRSLAGPAMMAPSMIASPSLDTANGPLGRGVGGVAGTSKLTVWRSRSTPQGMPWPKGTPAALVELEGSHRGRKSLSFQPEAIPKAVTEKVPEKTAAALRNILERHSSTLSHEAALETSKQQGDHVSANQALNPNTSWRRHSETSWRRHSETPRSLLAWTDSIPSPSNAGDRSTQDMHPQPQVPAASPRVKDSLHSQKSYDAPSGQLPARLGHTPGTLGGEQANAGSPVARETWMEAHPSLAEGYTPASDAAATPPALMTPRREEPPPCNVVGQSYFQEDARSALLPSLEKGTSVAPGISQLASCSARNSGGDLLQSVGQEVMESQDPVQIVSAALVFSSMSIQLTMKAFQLMQAQRPKQDNTTTQTTTTTSTQDQLESIMCQQPAFRETMQHAHSLAIAPQVATHPIPSDDNSIYHGSLHNDNRASHIEAQPSNLSGRSGCSLAGSHRSGGGVRSERGTGCNDEVNRDHDEYYYKTQHRDHVCEDDTEIQDCDHLYHHQNGTHVEDRDNRGLDHGYGGVHVTQQPADGNTGGGKGQCEYERDHIEHSADEYMDEEGGQNGYGRGHPASTGGQCEYQQDHDVYSGHEIEEHGYGRGHPASTGGQREYQQDDDVYSDHEIEEHGYGRGHPASTGGQREYQQDHEEYTDRRVEEHDYGKNLLSLSEDEFLDAGLRGQEVYRQGPHVPQPQIHGGKYVDEGDGHDNHDFSHSEDDYEHGDGRGPHANHYTLDSDHLYEHGRTGHRGCDLDNVGNDEHTEQWSNDRDDASHHSGVSEGCSSEYDTVSRATSGHVSGHMSEPQPHTGLTHRIDHTFDDEDQHSEQDEGVLYESARSGSRTSDRTSRISQHHNRRVDQQGHQSATSPYARIDSDSRQQQITALAANPQMQSPFLGFSYPGFAIDTASAADSRSITPRQRAHEDEHGFHRQGSGHMRAPVPPALRNISIKARQRSLDFGGSQGIPLLGQRSRIHRRSLEFGGSGGGGSWRDVDFLSESVPERVVRDGSEGGPGCMQSTGTDRPGGIHGPGGGYGGGGVGRGLETRRGNMDQLPDDGMGDVATEILAALWNGPDTVPDDRHDIGHDVELSEDSHQHHREARGLTVTSAALCKPIGTEETTRGETPKEVSVMREKSYYTQVHELASKSVVDSEAGSVPQTNGFHHAVDDSDTDSDDQHCDDSYDLARQNSASDFLPQSSQSTVGLSLGTITIDLSAESPRQGLQAETGRPQAFSGNRFRVPHKHMDVDNAFLIPQERRQAQKQNKPLVAPQQPPSVDDRGGAVIQRAGSRIGGDQGLTLQQAQARMASLAMPCVLDSAAHPRAMEHQSSFGSLPGASLLKQQEQEAVQSRGHTGPTSLGSSPPDEDPQTDLVQIPVQVSHRDRTGALDEDKERMERHLEGLSQNKTRGLAHTDSRGSRGGSMKRASEEDMGVSQLQKLPASSGNIKSGVEAKQVANAMMSEGELNELTDMKKKPKSSMTASELRHYLSLRVKYNKMQAECRSQARTLLA